MNIAYYPCGSVNTASSRLRVFKVMDVLRVMGHEVHAQTVILEAADVMVVQKRADMLREMSHWLARGKRVVFDVDDWIKFDLPHGAIVTVDTPAKLALYPDAVVIPDCLDVDANSPIKPAHADKLQRVVWVGNSENWQHCQYALEACRRLGLELTCITDLGSASYAQYPDVTGVQWSLASVDAEMVKADLFIAPFVFGGAWSDEWVKSKSANRILKAWSLGLPVAATPIQSYTEVGLQYSAQSVDEWVDTLQRLQSAEVRRADVLRGYDIAQQFTAEKVAQMWLRVFERK